MAAKLPSSVLAARQGPATLVLAASSDVMRSLWTLYVDLPLSVVRSVLARGQLRGDLLSLQAAVGMQRRLQHAQLLCMVLLQQALAILPQPVSRPISSMAAKLLGGQSLAAPRLVPSRPAAKGPSRAAVVLNELRCSQAEVGALAKLVLWCIQLEVAELALFDPQGLIKAHWSWLADEIAAQSQDGFSARQAPRAGCGLLQPYRRSPMALEVMAAPQPRDGQRCTVQLLSLGDTFAAISRLADQTKPERSAASTSAPAPREQPPDASNSSQAPVHAFHKVVDPQAVLVFGSCFTLGGFPPWLLQYAEIYHLGTLLKLSEDHLRARLQQYATTRQRFGS